MFRSGAHATVALVALAAAVYATASLTGGWLGTPPWWERWIAAGDMRCSSLEESLKPIDLPADHYRLAPRGIRDELYGTPIVAYLMPGEGREVISGSIAALGYGLFALAAWPRRDRPGRDEEPSP